MKELTALFAIRILSLHRDTLIVLLVLVEWSGLELCFIYLYIHLFLIGGVQEINKDHRAPC